MCHMNIRKVRKIWRWSNCNLKRNRKEEGRRGKYLPVCLRIKKNPMQCRVNCVDVLSRELLWCARAAAGICWPWQQLWLVVGSAGAFFPRKYKWNTKSVLSHMCVSFSIRCLLILHGPFSCCIARYHPTTDILVSADGRRYLLFSNNRMFIAVCFI